MAAEPTAAAPAAGGRLDGAVALVTGAGRGIGRGIARRLAGDGARVAVLDRDEAGCAATVREIVEAGGAAWPLVADLADPAARAAVVARVVERDGRLDLLVNNAGVVGPRVPLAEVDEADVRAVVEINLVAPLLLCRDALPHLARTRGAIVLVSSIQARLPLATFAPYVATKGALDALTRALAVEAAPAGVRVNAVAPGSIESPAMRAQWADATGSDARPPAPTLAGRWGTDADVAAVVAFLCSPAAAFVSGEIVRVDGGRLLSRDADPLNTPR